MKIRTLATVAAVVVNLAGIAGLVSWACEGTQKPNCFQTVYICKFAECVVVHPGAGQDIQIPIGVIPFVNWNTNPLCKQPTAARLVVDVTCEPGGIGPVVNVPTINIDLPTPTTPGILDVPAQGQGAPVPGGPLTLTIQGETLPLAGAPYCCEIKCTLEVDFGGNGLGSTLVTDMDTIKVYVMDPSPCDPRVPRVNLKHIDFGGPGFHPCLKGDQTCMFFLVENNDDKDLTLTFCATSAQQAQFPGGADPDGTLYSIASPIIGSDAAGLALEADLNNDGLLTLPDPQAISDQKVSTKFLLPQKCCAVIKVYGRPHGMCADGSCSRINVELFEDRGNDVRIACCSTAMVVQPAEPKWPLCEIRDTVSAGSGRVAAWTAGNTTLPHLITHAVGNLAPNAFPLTIQTIGEGLQGSELQPASATDYIRTEKPLDELHYQAALFVNNERTDNQVAVWGLGNLGGARINPTIFVPGFFHQGGGQLRVDVDLLQNQLRLYNQTLPTPIFTGPLDNLPIGLLPPGVTVDFGTPHSTGRQFAAFGDCFNGIPLGQEPIVSRDRLSGHDHLTVSNIGSSGEDGVSIDLDVTQGGNGVHYDAQLVGPGGVLQVPGVALTTGNQLPPGANQVSGQADEKLVVHIDPRRFPPSLFRVPRTNFFRVRLTTNTTNIPAWHQFIFRVKSDRERPRLPVKKFLLKRKFNKPNKDKLVVSMLFPVGPDFQREGAALNITVADRPYFFQWDRKATAVNGPMEKAKLIHQRKKQRICCLLLLKKDDLNNFDAYGAGNLAERLNKKNRRIVNSPIWAEISHPGLGDSAESLGDSLGVNYFTEHRSFLTGKPDKNLKVSGNAPDN